MLKKVQYVSCQLQFMYSKAPHMQVILEAITTKSFVSLAGHANTGKSANISLKVQFNMHLLSIFMYLRDYALPYQYSKMQCYVSLDMLVAIHQHLLR